MKKISKIASQIINFKIKEVNYYERNYERKILWTIEENNEKSTISSIFFQIKTEKLVLISSRDQSY